MSKSASKITSTQREFASLKNRRSVSVDTRARGSYVPEKKRPSSEERISAGNKLINRWGGARKSSINLTDAKRKDARPLTDKAYQKRKANDLVQFLDENGFSPPITVAKLLAPSKKDFENIFQFLYRFFDPAYEVKRIEDEGPKILKNLNYPFNVNKSAFVYVARTNYPSLLGVLIFLMDLNKFAMKVDMGQIFQSECDEEKAVHRILLRYIISCHHSGIDNEEEENAVFANIVKSSMGDGIEELRAKNEEKKLCVASVEEKINKHKSAVEHSALLDRNIEKFEEYIFKMKDHCQKKKAVCEQLMDEKKQKETVLKALQEETSKKQDLYDAQGFDGKKHLSYFETQKKELSEKLERKRDIVKDLKEKCWEIEIEYNKNVTEVTEAVKSAGKMYNDVVELVSRVLDPLLNIKTPQVKNLFSNFQLDFPVWEIHFNKRNVESSEVFRSAVKDVVEKIKSAGENLKRVCASMHQKLSEMEMKKSEISTKLKLLSIQENKEEQELSSKKKIAVDEISSLEAQCEKVSLAIKALHEEKLKFEKMYRDMIAEKNLLIEFRERKEKDLEEFLTELREMFAYFEENEEKAASLSEVYGNEIAEKLEELNDL